MKEFIDKLIGRLEELRKLEVDMICGYCQSTISKAIKIVNELAEEYKGGWIPCSERFPEDRQDVLVWDNNQEFCCVAWFNPTTRIWYSNDFDITDSENVIAWQPLPAPYKEGCE